MRFLPTRRVPQQRRWYGTRRQPTRGRGGFWGPFPYYSTRTRRGSRVTVTGCCLPLALGLFSLPVLAIRAALHR